MTTVRKEAELCDLFSEAAREDGWDVYPECGGWDLLLVWRGENTTAAHRAFAARQAGYQMGVEAKMRANCDVLAQAVGRMQYGKRPDAAAVLVPETGATFSSFERLAIYELGFSVFDMSFCEPRKDKFGWEIKRNQILPPSTQRYRNEPMTRAGLVDLPPVPLQSSGGCASPKTLSKWRVGSLRLVIALESIGHLTIADFKAQGVDKRLWVERGWVVGEGRGAAARYLPGPGLRDDGPVKGYQAEFDALREHDRETV